MNLSLPISVRLIKLIEEELMIRNLLFLLILTILSCKEQVQDNSIFQLQNNGQVFIFVHGAWGGGWEYFKVDSILTKKGSIVYRPTLTGLGERVHLGNKATNLTTHINDIVNVILFENLENIVLVGHSYGGMVISGVAEQVPEKIKQLVYLDAFVPKDGESIKSINGDKAWNAGIAPKIKDGYIPYLLGETDTIPPTDVPQPVETFTESLEISNLLVNKIPTSYILMQKDGKGLFQEGANRAKEKGWKIYKMEGDHYPMRNQPKQLVEKLEFILKN